MIGLIYIVSWDKIGVIVVDCMILCLFWDEFDWGIIIYVMYVKLLERININLSL